MFPAGPPHGDDDYARPADQATALVRHAGDDGPAAAPGTRRCGCGSSARRATSTPRTAAGGRAPPRGRRADRRRPRRARGPARRRAALARADLEPPEPLRAPACRSSSPARPTRAPGLTADGPRARRAPARELGDPRRLRAPQRARILGRRRARPTARSSPRTRTRTRLCPSPRNLTDEQLRAVGESRRRRRAQLPRRLRARRRRGRRHRHAARADRGPREPTSPSRPASRRSGSARTSTARPCPTRLADASRLPALLDALRDAGFGEDDAPQVALGELAPRARGLPRCEVDAAALAARRSRRSCACRASPATSAPVLELLAGAGAATPGLEADLHRARPRGAARASRTTRARRRRATELWGLTATLPGSAPGRLCLNGHVDVVGPGTAPWRHGPWSGAIEDGRAARARRGGHEGRGGRRRCTRWRRCARPAPRARGRAAVRRLRGGRRARDVRRAGARRRVRRRAASPSRPASPSSARRPARSPSAASSRGRAAHAAERLAGCSAIDRYVRVHAALAAHERARQRRVAHPLMRALELPYPLLVGRVAAGEWSSQVPDRARVRGPRSACASGRTSAAARAALEARVRGARRRRAAVELDLGGRRLRPGRDAAGPPWVQRVRAALSRELAARRASPACRGAPTCACSRRAGSRP